MRKAKLSIDAQIEHMKNEKGILFNLVNEDTARMYLKNNNYYFRIKAYAKNYEQYIYGPKKGKYINLEFAFLQELAILDMHLRKLLFQMTIDIEHYLKTQLLRDFESNGDEDGYNIIALLFSANSNIKPRIVEKHSGYCLDLIDKYKDQFALWNIIEVMSFGDFIALYRLYYETYPSKDDLSNFLFSVKKLRNATAHNNCLLNSLKKPYGRRINPNKKYTTYLSTYFDFGPRIKKNKMTNAVIHDIVVSIHTFSTVVSSQSVKRHSLAALRSLIHKRMARNRHYFSKNEEIKSSYWFIRKIVDYYYNISL